MCVPERVTVIRFLFAVMVVDGRVSLVMDEDGRCMCVRNAPESRM